VTSTVRRVSGLALGLLVFAACLAIWEIWARGGAPFHVPKASDVIETAWHEWPNRDFLGAAWTSLRRLALGYAIAAVIGIGFGLLVGTSLRARRTLDPFFELLRAVPVIAIVPVAILVLGLGDAERIAVIAIGLVFPILLNTIGGVRAIPPEVRDTASMLHVGRVERVLRVYLPAALPSIFTGLRIALSLGLILVVISEFVGQQDGLGNYILVQQAILNFPELYAGILFLGLLGYLLNTLFLMVERRVLAWHYGAAGE